MATLSPTEFLGSLKGKDFIRGNLFEVIFPIPFAGLADVLKFRVKSAPIPSSLIGQAPVFFNGREIKLAGDREISDVSLIAYMTKDIYEALVGWQESMNGSISNTALVDTLDGYSTDVILNILDRQENIIQEVKYINAWVSEMSEISFAWDDKDTIKELELTLTMTNYEIAGVSR